MLEFLELCHQESNLFIQFLLLWLHFRVWKPSVLDNLAYFHDLGQNFCNLLTCKLRKFHQRGQNFEAKGERMLLAGSHRLYHDSQYETCPWSLWNNFWLCFFIVLLLHRLWLVIACQKCWVVRWVKTPKVKYGKRLSLINCCLLGLSWEERDNDGDDALINLGSSHLGEADEIFHKFSLNSNAFDSIDLNPCPESGDGLLKHIEIVFLDKVEPNVLQQLRWKSQFLKFDLLGELIKESNFLFPAGRVEMAKGRLVLTLTYLLHCALIPKNIYSKK